MDELLAEEDEEDDVSEELDDVAVLEEESCPRTEANNEAPKRTELKKRILED